MQASSAIPMLPPSVSQESAFPDRTKSKNNDNADLEASLIQRVSEKNLNHEIQQHEKPLARVKGINCSEFSKIAIPSVISGMVSFALGVYAGEHYEFAPKFTLIAMVVGIIFMGLAVLYAAIKAGNSGSIKTEERELSQRKVILKQLSS